MVIMLDDGDTDDTDDTNLTRRCLEVFEWLDKRQFQVARLGPCSDRISRWLAPCLFAFFQRLGVATAHEQSTINHHPIGMCTESSFLSFDYHWWLSPITGYSFWVAIGELAIWRSFLDEQVGLQICIRSLTVSQTVKLRWTSTSPFWRPTRGMVDHCEPIQEWLWDRSATEPLSALSIQSFGFSFSDKQRADGWTPADERVRIAKKNQQPSKHYLMF